MKYKLGQRVKVTKYKTAQFYGTIEQIDPIFGPSLKKTVGYWYVIKYTDTVPYFCEQGELGLFTNRDIEAA